jgi:hypothetical protein
VRPEAVINSMRNCGAETDRKAGPDRDNSSPPLLSRRLANPPDPQEELGTPSVAGAPLAGPEGPDGSGPEGEGGRARSVSVPHAGTYSSSACLVVGAASIAKALHVQPATVYSWGKRDNSPIPIYRRWNGSLWTTQAEIDKCWGRSDIAYSPNNEMEREAELAVQKALDETLPRERRS